MKTRTDVELYEVMRQALERAMGVVIRRMDDTYGNEWSDLAEVQDLIEAALAAVECAFEWNGDDKR